jgi:hypothetical protein
MAATPKKGPRPAPGYEAEWAEVNREEERQEAEFGLIFLASLRTPMLVGWIT